MKKLFICAAALGLFVSLPAAAQNNDRHGDKNDASSSHTDRGAVPAGANRGGQGHGGGEVHAKPNAAPATANRGGAAGQQHAPDVMAHKAQSAPANRYLPASGDVHPGVQTHASPNGRQNNAGWQGNNDNHRPAINSRPGNMGRPNNAATHPDINSLRHNMQASRHFRGGSYSAPRGYQSRHWSYGERLPRGYFVRNYWIANFVMFDLFAPPPGLVWVRVGDDALLIDQISGDIVQVRYGVFY